MKTLLVALLLAGSLCAQITVNIGTFTLPSKSAQSVTSWMLAQRAGQTALTAPQTADDTTVTLNSMAGVSVGTSLVIESEAELVTAINGKVATVTRAQLLSVAAIHASLAPAGIMQYATVEAVIKAFIATRLQNILQAYPSSSIAALNATIATAQASITAEVAATQASIASELAAIIQ